MSKNKKKLYEYNSEWEIISTLRDRKGYIKKIKLNKKIKKKIKK